MRSVRLILVLTVLPVAVLSIANLGRLGDGQQTTGATAATPTPTPPPNVFDGPWGSSPRLASDGAGHLVAVSSTMKYSASSDDGQTWSDPEHLNSWWNNPNYDDNDPVVATDGAGTWIAVWESNYAFGGANANGDQDIAYSRSTNNGATWSAPQMLNSTGPAGNGLDYSPQIAYGSGAWVVAWVSTDSGTSTPGIYKPLRFARSTDSGATWTEAALVAPIAGTGPYFNGEASNESGGVPAIATDGLGVWAIVASSNYLYGQQSQGRNIVIHRSTTNGISWYEPQLLNNDYSSGPEYAVYPYIASGGANTWLASWTRGPVGDVVAVSTNSGITWPNQYTTPSGGPIYSQQGGTWLRGSLTWSTDNGSTWTPRSDVGTNIVSAVRLSDGRWMVAGYFYGGKYAICDVTDYDCDTIANVSDNCSYDTNLDQINQDSDTLGNACDNCPTWTNQSQTLPPWYSPPNDEDCDGYPSTVPHVFQGKTLRAAESEIGTAPAAHCAATSMANDEGLPDAWPPDFNDNQLVNGGDWVSFNSRFGATSGGTLGQGSQPYSARWDLNNNGVINGADMLHLNAYFGKRCDS